MTHLHHGVVHAAHHDGPVEGGDHPVGRPAHEGPQLHVGRGADPRHLQDHGEGEDEAHGAQVEGLQPLQSVGTPLSA